MNFEHAIDFIEKMCLTFQWFAWLYGKAGKCSDLTMVNSSWTEDHINKIWCQTYKQVYKIYPPCDVQKFKQLQRESETGDESPDQEVKTIVSLGKIFSVKNIYFSFFSQPKSIIF